MKPPADKQLTMARAMNAQEASYMQGPKQPATPSVMISSSKFLNSPNFRDAWSQMSLRRFGSDVADTYDIPWMVRGIRDVVDFSEFTRLVAEEKARNPEFADFLAARRLARYAHGSLDKYAPGTVGAIIRWFVEDSGMQQEFTGIGEAIEHDVDFVMKRRGLTHDIDHLVTGFWFNTLGEIALAAANNMAIGRYFPSGELTGILSMATAFTASAYTSRNLFVYPAATVVTYEALELGIQAGRALKKPLFMHDWDDYLDWPLTELRAHLGLPATPERGLWDDVDPMMHG